jgi:hypothetical protein
MSTLCSTGTACSARADPVSGAHKVKKDIPHNLCDGKGVEAARQRGVNSGLCAVVLGVDQGENRVYPDGAHYVPAFVPLLQIFNILFNVFSLKCKAD